MEAKITISEILKDKKNGLRLYSPIFGECTFCCVREDTNDICVKKHNGVKEFFDSKGLYYNTGEVMLFPSKEMRDWSKFFKKGDVLLYFDGKCKVIFDKFDDDKYTSFIGKHYLESYGKDGELQDYEEIHCGSTVKYTKESEEAAQTYIKTIEERLGGKLNRETLEIEKTMPELYEGDIAFADYGNRQDIFIVTGRTSSYDGYTSFISLDLNHMTLSLGCKTSFFKKDLCELRLATEEEKIKLFDALTMEGKYWDAEKKMIVDLKTLQKFKPFDKVIIRLGDHDTWKADFYSHYCANGEAYTVGDVHISDPRYILPYEGNESLLGTANSPK